MQMALRGAPKVHVSTSRLSFSRFASADFGPLQWSLRVGNFTPTSQDLSSELGPGQLTHKDHSSRHHSKQHQNMQTMDIRGRVNREVQAVN